MNIAPFFSTISLSLDMAAGLCLISCQFFFFCRFQFKEFVKEEEGVKEKSQQSVFRVKKKHKSLLEFLIQER
jgi:hypothetical protein